MRQTQQTEHHQTSSNPHTNFSPLAQPGKAKSTSRMVAFTLSRPNHPNPPRTLLLRPRLQRCNTIIA